ncbi:MAG: hypothetical protein IPJ65_14000 [Archangiaceae bacterium]|nr:hypothetical protein [Archangiaceae bacterium]
MSVFIGTGTLSERGAGCLDARQGGPASAAFNCAFMERAALLAAWVLLGGCAGTGEGLDAEGKPLRADAGSDGGAPAADGGFDGGGGAGDGGAHDGGAVDERTRFAWIQRHIFTETCAVYCHRGASAPKGLQLEASKAYDKLVGVSSVELPELMRVKPGAPQDSYLYVKIVPTDARRVGERMPLDEPPYLSAEKIEAVRGWIARGAPKD